MFLLNCNFQSRSQIRSKQKSDTYRVAFLLFVCHFTRKSKNIYTTFPRKFSKLGKFIFCLNLSTDTIYQMLKIDQICQLGISISMCSKENYLGNTISDIFYRILTWECFIVKKHLIRLIKN